MCGEVHLVALGDRQQDTAKQNSLQINRRVLVFPSDKPAHRKTEAMAAVLRWRGKNACSLAIYRLRALQK